MDFKTINPSVIEQFRSGQEIEGVPGVSRENHILLTTVGRQSGQPRTTPVRIFLARENQLIVVGGNGGLPTNPAWYLNLVADPVVTVEDSKETYQAVATVVTGGERDELWALFQEQIPGLAALAGAAGRELPVVALTRR